MLPRCLFYSRVELLLIKANTVNTGTVERPLLLSNRSHILEFARRVLYVVWRSTTKFKGGNNPRQRGSIEHSNKKNPNIDLGFTCEFHPFNLEQGVLPRSRIGVCFYLLHSLSFAYIVNEGTREKEPGIEVKFCYDVIPYVTTSVFPESHTGIIYIGGILTAPQSLSYRKSARPGKCSKSSNQRHDKKGK